MQWEKQKIIALYHDCMGITLGKKLDQAAVNKIYEGRLYLPLSISGYYTTTVLGYLFLSASRMHQVAQ